jgi:predicted alpha/beta hydrolase
VSGLSLLSLLLLIPALLLLGWLHTRFWTRYFRLDRGADETHRVETADGWTLALHRYKPARRRFREPVLLCHGVGANRFNFDLADDRSLARTLASRGFDVFSLELRGAGQSLRPARFGRRRADYDFDTHLEKDIPAAVAHVRASCGGEPVFWIGHSMGGMLGLARLGLRGEHGIKGLVAVASPVMLRQSRSARFFLPLVRLMALSPVVHFRAWARFFSPFFGWGLATLSTVAVSRRGIEGALLRRAMVNLVDDTSGRLLRQFIDWIRSERFCSRDGTQDYLANLAKIEEPVLVLGAEADRLAPPASVEPAYERLGSRDKQVRIFGVDRGDDFDFGHGDILIGSMARKVVYPEILVWLKARATRLSQKDTPSERPASTPPGA